ncbi:hypothetical protein BZARG_797 [Bizionia argentinensis JUB59]|uniref:Tail fiber protein n=1 Tax=Bizionia argentinensis JUB59 TaxID=1046627 RepID=G2EBB4_9FLAO|nr:hypothetical protein [Bizionia argentinensis]EGV44439.1 hypothetical protein BZARG_797 [Bizionia argentinensis JUB59]6OV6_A Chain A, C24 PROTEIN [Bizionia argentinensis JUB59]6OV6_B Chain B, C24 PROTEIN [Bizionia argentinensis JUB59]6OV6_C Chain C, C24 PROTEIN [Bizionia argentinensis JUB59]
MNKQNFLQTGGFPLETDTLNAMQEAYSVFNALGELAGNKAIIKGCVVSGSTTTDGVVYINGEVFKFVGGQTQSRVKILETSTSKEFEDGSTNAVHFERYVTFASGTGSISWAEFAKLTTLRELSRRLLPAGTNPQLYSGSVNNIPSGWQLCDGTNGTENLKGSFIVGYDPNDSDYNAIGKVGGTKKVTPSGNLDSRSINVTVPRDGWSTFGSGLGAVKSGRIVVGSGQQENSEYLESLRASGIDRTLTSTPHSHTFTGNQQDNRAPYYTLAYIIYIG